VNGYVRKYQHLKKKQKRTSGRDTSYWMTSQPAVVISILLYLLWLFYFIITATNFSSLSLFVVLVLDLISFVTKFARYSEQENVIFCFYWPYLYNLKLLCWFSFNKIHAALVKLNAWYLSVYYISPLPFNYFQI
jgi:hypothetical protein